MTNIPDSDFPDIPRNLNRHMKLPSLSNRKRQRHLISARDITCCRVIHKATGYGTWVHPAYLYNGEWYKFFNGEEPLTTFYPRMLSLSKPKLIAAENEWEDWIKEWADLNNSDAYIIPPPKKKVTELEKAKKEKPICGICKKSRYRLFKPNMICGKCLDQMFINKHRAEESQAQGREVL